MAALAGAVAVAIGGCDSDGETPATNEPARPADTAQEHDSRRQQSRDEATSPLQRPKPTTPDRDPRSGDRSGRAAHRPRPDVGGAAERRVASAVEEMYADFAAADAAGVCSALVGPARRQIAQQVPGGSTVAPRRRTCADSMSVLLEAASGSGVLERTLGAEVVGVSISGDTATATVSFGNASGRVRLRKVEGAWRLGTPPAAPSP